MKCVNYVAPRFGSIRNGQGGCKYCAGVYLDESDAVSALLKAGFKPLEDYPGSQLPWLAECVKCGKASSPTLSNINSLDSGCKFCAAKAKAEKRKTPQDEILAVLKSAKLEPLGNFTYENNKTPIACRCLVCNHMVNPTLGSLNRGSGCGYCAGKRVDPDSAENLMKLNGLKPLVRYPGSSAPWKCLCLTCEKEVSPTYGSVQSGHSGCAYCAGKVVDLEEAAALMKQRNLLPLEPYPGSAVPWKSQCLVCGQQTSPRLSNLKIGHGGCLNCAGKLVDPDNAVELMIASNLQPLEPYPGRHTPWRSQCMKCHREVSPTYGTVARGSSCRFCADIGIDYTSPGYVYLITHQGMMSHKIGIANTHPRKKYYDRLKQHLAKGRLFVSRHEFSSADTAFKVEQQFLNWVRSDIGLGVYLSSAEMPQGGYTETFSGADSIKPFSAKLQEIAKQYGE